MQKDDPARGRKRAAAIAALAYVEPGAVLGVGSGSTVNELLEVLAPQASALGVTTCVAASAESEARLRAAGIVVRAPGDVDRLGVYIDGADEIDPAFRMLKGGGGALTREKLLASAARRFVCIVDESKERRRLGEGGAPVVLEVLPVAAAFVTSRIAALGGVTVARAGFVSDGGNAIFDVAGLDLSDPDRLEATLDRIPGIVENGVFAARRADVLLVGAAAGVITRVRS